jgi:outer membrane protein assembly factor BamB
VHPARRTTISCRFIAPTVGLLILLTVAATPARQAAVAAAPDTAVQSLMPVLQWFVAVAAAPSVPPVAAADRLYVALRSGALAAHRISNGAALWSIELAAEQPLAADETHLFVASGEAVHALQGSSGQIAWRAPTGNATAPPLVHAGWVIVAGGNALIAFRATDGTRVWQQDVGPIVHRPFIDGDVLFAAFTDGRVVALDLKNGNPLWEQRLPGPAGELLVLDDRVYVASGDKHFNCLDASSGTVEWRYRFGAEARGRPAADTRRVYFAALDNELRALDRRHGALRWHHGLPFRPSSGPIVLGVNVAIPGPVAEFRMFDATSGKPVKSFRFAQPLVTAPAVLAEGEPLRLRIAAITGGLNSDWKLTLLGPAGEPPEELPLVPLSVLPGVVTQPGT